MEITANSKNVILLKLNEFEVLVSYKTVVACRNRSTKEVWITAKRWSATTSRHVSSWLKDIGVDPKTVKPVGQEVLDKLI